MAWRTHETGDAARIVAETTGGQGGGEPEFLAIIATWESLGYSWRFSRRFGNAPGRNMGNERSAVAPESAGIAYRDA
jgi:hypothetical protein